MLPVLEAMLVEIVRIGPRPHHLEGCVVDDIVVDVFGAWRRPGATGMIVRRSRTVDEVMVDLDVVMAREDLIHVVPDMGEHAVVDARVVCGFSQDAIKYTVDDAVPDIAVVTDLD